MTYSKSLLFAHAVALSILTITYRGASNFKDITDALAFYGVYHRNPINQIIHFFGVPCIIWSLLVFLAHLKLKRLPLGSSSLSLPFAPVHSLSYATILTLGYILFYIKLDTFGGILYTPFAYFLYVTAVSAQRKDEIEAKRKCQMNRKKKNDSDIDNTDNTNNTSISWTGTGRVLKIAAMVHFLGWYVQIHPGHGIYEGAKPAIMQSIGGALTSAPLFAYYEGLWFLGLNKGLQEETAVLVDLYTKKLCDSGDAVMRACADYN
jgi:uncharacterized membrane protein YGL010W